MKDYVFTFDSKDLHEVDAFRHGLNLQPSHNDSAVSYVLRFIGLAAREADKWYLLSPGNKLTPLNFEDSVRDDLASRDAADRKTRFGLSLRDDTVPALESIRTRFNLASDEETVRFALAMANKLREKEAKAGAGVKVIYQKKDGSSYRLNSCLL